MCFGNAAIDAATVSKVVCVNDQESHRSNTNVFYHLAADSFALEILDGNIPGGPARFFIVGFDRVDSRQDLIHRPESEQAFAAGNELAESCLLSDYGLAAR